jgi:hypothetical protein
LEIVQIALRIRIARVLGEMALLSFRSILIARYEIRRDELARSGGSDHVEVAKTIHGHADADRPALEKILHAVAFDLSSMTRITSYFHALERTRIRRSLPHVLPPATFSIGR